MIVKICGITRLRDARFAAEAGADFLGFICYPKSPRYIPPAGIAAIVSGIRQLSLPVRTVGVFVNESPATILRVLDEAGLDLAQLHGDELPESIEALAGRAFKALRPTALAEVEAAAREYAAHAPPQGPDLLIDAYHPDAYGGLGQLGDWHIAAALARRYRLFLAGGITPANVAEAMAEVQPWGIDVSSGVEQAPGIKDSAAMQALISAVKGLSAVS